MNEDHDVVATLFHTVLIFVRCVESFMVSHHAARNIVGTPAADADHDNLPLRL
jgi:hypothetical protein